MNRVGLRFAAALCGALSLVLAAGCGEEEGEGPAPAGGRIWVVDQPNTVVRVYDYGGEALFDVGNFGFFLKPNCVEIDRRDGSAWVLDYYVNKLRKFDRTGGLLFETGTGEGGEPLIRRATSIAVDQASGACWVADRSHSRVLKLGPNGQVLATVTGFRSPRSVSLVADTGDCWAADELQRRVVKVRADASGAVTVGGVKLAECGGFDVPWSVAADPAGGVWVLDRGVGAVVRVSAAGRRTTEVTGFGFPYGAAISGGADCVFVSDYEKGWLAAFPRGTTGTRKVDAVAKLFLTGLPYPTDVELDEDGGYCFVTASDAVRRYTTTGDFINSYEGLGLPVAVAADPAP
jgi:DNA-binding beta-propeller fold protein YncE